MRYILVLLIAAGFAGYLLPAQQERTSTPCEALARKLRDMAEEDFARLPQAADPKAQAAFAQVRAKLPDAATLEGLARAQIPMLPPQAGCATGYWVAVFKPEMLRSVVPAALPPR